MNEKVAVATVQGKTYFLIVNGFREQDIPFISLVPGESVPAKIMLVLTTEQEKHLINHEKILVFQGEDELDRIINQVKTLLLGKIAFQRLVFGIDPGIATGLAAIADGNVIEGGNCFSIKELITSILKIMGNINFHFTKVSVKIGNGVPFYKEILESLDSDLPPQVAIEVVSEAGTNKPLKENNRSRRVRHISSAIRIARRNGKIVPRRKIFAAHSRIQQNNAS
jgi:hypothetical protein